VIGTRNKHIVRTILGPVPLLRISRLNMMIVFQVGVHGAKGLAVWLLVHSVLLPRVKRGEVTVLRQKLLNVLG